MPPHFNPSPLLSRRTAAIALLGGGAAIALPARSQPPAADCPRCGGLGRVPLAEVRPWVWIEPAATPKWDAAVGEAFCSACHDAAGAEALVNEVREQFAAALESHRRWEEWTGWKLTCAITRHATLHSQLMQAQTRATAQALEALMLHLKRVSGSLALTSTRPNTLELMLLQEKSSWDAFRKVMEERFTREELGEAWSPARELNAYDHQAIPHLYETRETIRARPPSCCATFIVARRQLNRATGWKAPFWLAEGFAAYCDYIVHKTNRWYTTYAGETVPPGDWMVKAKQLAADSTHRGFDELFRRDLRDWEPADHFQTMAIVAFLFESEPAKFLDYWRRLGVSDSGLDALERAYGASSSDLEDRWAQWMLARR